MGSICYNFKKERWEILREGRLKSNGKHVYIVGVGYCDDDYGSGGYLIVIMLDEIKFITLGTVPRLFYFDYKK